MTVNTNTTVETLELKYSLWQEISLLTKSKLSMTVVFTSLLGYFIAAAGKVDIAILALLAVGGFAVTAAANIINEVLEKDFDILMTRTAVRPIAAGRIKPSTAVLSAGLVCLFGIICLSMINPLSSMLGMLSFVVYAFIYTPLKRVSTVAVAIGAIPGALPVMIGCTAAEGTVSILGVGLFAIQFLWQFPHFWSIGYLAFDEYKKAGFKLVPENLVGEGVDPKIGLHSTIYTILILPVVGYLYFIQSISMLPLVLCIAVTLIFLYFAVRFMITTTRKTALSLMFASFFYMPLILLIILLTR